MLNDYNPVYDEDLSFCDKIMKDIVYQYVYDSDVYQRMMVGREAARVQRNVPVIVEDMEDANNVELELEQIGPTMQGM